MADKKVVRLEATVPITQDPHTMVKDLDAELRRTEPTLQLEGAGFNRVEVPIGTTGATANRRWVCWVEGREK